MKRLTMIRQSIAWNDELHHAIAIDIGTTTIVVYLVCTSNGKIINVESSLNPQVAYGADVISRINFIAESEPNLKLLQKKLVEELDCMIARLLAHYQGLCIDSIVVSGNSTMEHIFAVGDFSCEHWQSPICACVLCAAYIECF